MAVNFNVLRREGPMNLYEGFEQGQRLANENALAQQKIAQERELNALRGMELRSSIRANEEKRAQDARVLRASQFKEQLLRAPNAEVMRNVIRAQHADPILGPTLRQFGSLDQDLADVPDDPSKLEDFRRREAMGLSKWIESRGEISDINKIMGTGASAAAPTTRAPAAAPAPEGELVAAPIGGIPSPITAPAAANAPAPAGETDLAYLQRQFGMPGGAAPAPAAVNALIPAAPVAAPAAAPTNAMLTSVPTDVESMRRKRDALLALGTPRAKALAEGVSADIRAIAAAMPEDVKLLQALGKAVTEDNIKQLARLKQNPGEFARLLEASGLPQEAQTVLIRRRLEKEATHPSAANVKVVLPPLESAEQKGQGELNIKSFGEIRDAARLATRTLPALETQTKILDQGFTTGFGTEVQKAAASVLAALGVEKAENFATNAQTFLAATQQAVLQKQLEQKGTQTKADADRITETGAQLGNTVRGNRFIIDVAREQLRRDIEQRDFYANWWANKKTYEGAENAWYASEGGKSLFDRPALKKYLAPSAAEADKRTQGLDKIFKQPGR